MQGHQAEQVHSSLGISHQTSVCTVSVRHTHQVNVEWCHTPQISAFDAHSHEFNWTIRQERPRVVGPSWGAELMGKLHSFLQLLLLVNLWEPPSNINKEHFACQDWVGVALWNKTKKEKKYWVHCLLFPWNVKPGYMSHKGLARTTHKTHCIHFTPCIHSMANKYMFCGLNWWSLESSTSEIFAISEWVMIGWTSLLVSRVSRMQFDLTSCFCCSKSLLWCCSIPQLCILKLDIWICHMSPPLLNTKWLPQFQPHVNSAAVTFLLKNNILVSQSTEVTVHCVHSMFLI